MNNIDELIEIIKELNNLAHFEEIIKAFQIRHNMLLFSNHKKIILDQLQNNSNIFAYDEHNNVWSIIHNDKKIINTYNSSIVDKILEEFVDGYFVYRDVKSSNGEIQYRIATPSDKRICDIIKSKRQYKVYSAIELKAIEKYYDNYSNRKGEHRPYRYHIPLATKSNDSKLIVCRVAYMKNYNGINEEDKPVNGGSYVQKTGDAEEKYNFYNFNGYCYGFVETKHTNGVNNKLHIENIDSNYKGKESIDNVRVIFVSSNPNTRKNVVVGWYDNAKVFVDRQYHTINGNEHQYNLLCNYDDSHLINDENRKFEIPNASVAGNDYGIGQSNIWYIQNNEKASKFLEDLVDYINSISN